MFRQGKRTIAAAFLGVLVWTLPGAPSDAAGTPRDLWATVNICNTASHPDQLGVRGSMPGNGRRQRMYMRFHAQYYNQTSKRWFDVRGLQGVTGWVYAGTARTRARQAGYTFTLEPPPSGRSFLLRGSVEFQWRAFRRRRGHRRLVVVRRAHAFTSAQHPSAGADPQGYSSGTCEIRSP